MYNRFRKEKKGFTLVEIIVVLVILAILAAFTIPAMLGFVDDARKKSILMEGHEVLTAFHTSFTEIYGNGFNGTSTLFTDKRSDSATNGQQFYMINNWSYTNEGQKQKYASDSSNQIAWKMKTTLGNDVTPYTGGSDYMGKTLQEANKTINDNNKFAMVIFYTADGKVAEFYYIRGGYMWVYKSDGTSATYSTKDNAKIPGYTGGGKNPGTIIWK